MLEEIYSELQDAYEQHKLKYHSECNKIHEQKDGTMFCHGINEFEATVQHMYENKKHRYLIGLSKAENYIVYHNQAIKGIEAKFIDGIHMHEMEITLTKRGSEPRKEMKLYKFDIDKDYIQGLINNDLPIDKSLLLSHAFSDIKIHIFLLENPPIDMNKLPHVKMQWKGNQKQLAELFIELHKKGWIEKLEPKTVQEMFTNTKSIKQYLKPTQTKLSDYKPTYEKLYGPEYSPQFDNIKNCINS